MMNQSYSNAEYVNKRWRHRTVILSDSSSESSPLELTTTTTTTTPASASVTVSSASTASSSSSSSATISTTGSTRTTATTNTTNSSTYHYENNKRLDGKLSPSSSAAPAADMSSEYHIPLLDGQRHYSTFQNPVTSSTSIGGSRSSKQQHETSYTSSTFPTQLHSRQTRSTGFSFSNSIGEWIRFGVHQSPFRSSRRTTGGRGHGHRSGGGVVVLRQHRDGKSRVVTIAWRIILLFSVIIFALFACLHGSYYNYMIPEWQWDHNVYVPAGMDESSSSGNNGDEGRIAVIAQIVSSRSLRKLTDISSRPNRAYARQWAFDYALYDSGRVGYSPKACFDKVFVLNTILQHQSKDATDSLSLWSHLPRVTYDSIILLPPDCIVTDLDVNLFNRLLPRDKLVAIAGWTESKKLSSNSDIIVLNLRHKYAETVSKIWLEMILPQDITCGANNDLGMLVTAIASVMDPEMGEDLDDLIQPLEETSDGFVGDHNLIRCIPPSVPGSRSALLMSNIQDTIPILQGTADAVCYRFYPKCEVL